MVRDTDIQATIDEGRVTVDVGAGGGEDDVVLRGISHFFGRNQVLSNVSLVIRRGEFFGILGPSGSGKTTTMRLMGSIPMTP